MTYALLKDVSARLCIAGYHQRALAFHDIETRLADLVLTLLEAYGRQDTVGWRLVARVSYPMLARCLGVTERSIERTVGKWLKEGWFVRERGRYWVRDLAALKGRTAPQRLALFSKLGLDPHGD